jgi:hypothetical protein
MSAFNFFDTEHKATDLRTITLTTKSGKTTYTAKTGRVADNFVMDRVINVVTTSTYSMTITVPDGVYMGQLLLVSFKTEGGTETVDVTTTTGDDATQMTDDGGYWLGMWIDSVNGWKTIASSAT